MSSHQITTIKVLREYLQTALQLEHATIPPYLIALYSIRPGTNRDAFDILRVVAVEEMRHLTLAANVLNAVGGKPDLTVPGFVPLYPAFLPDGEKDFQVNLQSFSQDAVNTFLKIERPAKAPDEAHKLVPRRRRNATQLAAYHGSDEMQYYSIGEFYDEIVRGLEFLYQKEKDKLDKLFADGAKLQVTSEYFYSGGGQVFPVTNMESAQEALRQIIEQGEGRDAGIFDKDNELAHYYRFMQLYKKRYYQPGDTDPENPTGPPLQVDWDSVYPLKSDARLTDYPEGSELRAAAVAFNQSYADFLALLTSAYNGRPQLLLEAVPLMFRLRNKINQLIHNPIPGMAGVNAAPTFEMVYASQAVTT